MRIIHNDHGSHSWAPTTCHNTCWGLQPSLHILTRAPGNRHRTAAVSTSEMSELRIREVTRLVQCHRAHLQGPDSQPLPFPWHQPAAQMAVLAESHPERVIHESVPFMLVNRLSSLPIILPSWLGVPHLTTAWVHRSPCWRNTRETLWHVAKTLDQGLVVALSLLHWVA